MSLLSTNYSETKSAASFQRNLPVVEILLSGSRMESNLAAYLKLMDV